VNGARLDAIVAAVRRRAEERRRSQPIERLRDLVREDSWRRERFLVPFPKGGFAILGEMKRRAPWSGTQVQEGLDERSTLPTRTPRPGPNWFSLAQAFQKGGAAAISVVTELDHFSGVLDDLRAVEFTRLPRLRRDFVVDEAMLWESCLFGADAVVLEPAILTDGELATLRNVARELGLAVLAIAHDERQVDRAQRVEPELLGIGARDVDSGQVDAERFGKLLPGIAAGPIRVALDGIGTIEDLENVRRAGADAAVVGEAFASAEDPEATLREWKRRLGI
jgi:indole-3-glycerol phosphate synthase